MKQDLIFILVSILLINCSNTNTSSVKYLQQADSVIHIPINSNISSTTRNLRYFKDKEIEYIATENNHLNSIDIFNLNSRTLCKTVTPQIYGPDGIGTHILGFDIVNFDTIIVGTNGIADKLFIIDSSAHLYEKIKFEISYEPYLPIPFLFSANWGGNSANYDGEKLTLSAVCRTDESDFYKVDTCPAGYIYNLKTHKTEKLQLRQPEIIKLNPPIVYSESSILINQNKKIFSYELGHQVFVSTNDSSWTVYNLKSKYVKKPFNPGFGNDIIGSQTKFVESPAYLALVYDKYRHVYYRFVYPGIDVAKGDDVMKLCEFCRIFSVMIIDEDFNVLGETLMPENTYNSNMFFINEAGLWISTNHPDNPDFEEDAINFQLFNLK